MWASGLYDIEVKSLMLRLQKVAKHRAWHRQQPLKNVWD